MSDRLMSPSGSQAPWDPPMSMLPLVHGARKVPPKPVVTLEGDDDLAVDTRAHRFGVRFRTRRQGATVEAAHGAEVGVVEAREVGVFVIDDAGTEAHALVRQRDHAPSIGADAERRETAEPRVRRRQGEAAAVKQDTDPVLAGFLRVELNWFGGDSHRLRPRGTGPDNQPAEYQGQQDNRALHVAMMLQPVATAKQKLCPENGASLSIHRPPQAPSIGAPS